MGGGSGGGGQTPTQSTTNTSNLPEYARPYFERMMGRSEEESNQGYVPYQGARVSGFTPDTQAGFAATRDVAARGMPEMDQANYMSGAAGAVGLNASNYQSNPIQQQAIQQQNIQSGNIYGQNIQSKDIQQQAFGQDQAQQYMSPYMSEVIDRQKAAAVRDFNEQRPGRETQAIKSGAFGGYRSAIQEGVAERGLQNRMSDIEGLGREQAFQNAQSQYERDRTSSMQTQQANRDALTRALEGNRASSIQVQQANRDAAVRTAEGNRASSLQVQEANRAAYMQAQGMTEQQRLAAAQYGLSGASLGLQAGSTMGQLGSTRQDMALKQAQALQAQGTAQQNLDQRELDTQYQDFINQKDFNKQQIAYMSNILRGVPVQPTTVQTQYANPNPIAQYGGLGIAGLGLARS